jgi:16S rRNA (guanine527-N7)-methyltransferase
VQRPRLRSPRAPGYHLRVTKKPSAADATDPEAARALLPHVRRVAERLGGQLSDSEADSLARYAALVRGWNTRVNLTAARTDASLCEVLLADALVLRAPELIADGTRLVDVGTGAGAPLLPLLLLRPDLSAVGIEPLHKRVAFLRTAAARLGLLERLQVRLERVEPDAPAVAGGPFELACSRATFAPELWLRVGLSLAPAVLVLAVDDTPPGVLPERVELACARSYTLPFSGAPRCALRYERGG